MGLEVMGKKRFVEEFVAGAVYQYLDQPVLGTGGGLLPYYCDSAQVLGLEFVGEYSEYSNEPLGMYNFIKKVLGHNKKFAKLMRYLVDHSGAKDYDLFLGGQTKGWIFSQAAAILAKKPLLCFFKAQGGRTPLYIQETGVEGKLSLDVPSKTLLFDDLLNTGASFTKKGALLDQVEEIGVFPELCYVFIDRNQGGREQLCLRGAVLESAVLLDEPWFSKYDPDHMGELQHYLASPLEFAVAYLEKNGGSCLGPYLSSGKDNRLALFFLLHEDSLKAAGLYSSIFAYCAPHFTALADPTKGLVGGESLEETLRTYKNPS